MRWFLPTIIINGINLYVASIEVQIYHHLVFHINQGYLNTSRSILCLEKMSCWSINHTQQEYDNSKKKFGDYHSKYKAQPEYEQNLQS